MADNVNNDKNVIHSNKIIGEAGRLELNSHYEVDGIGSHLPLDRSHVILQDKFKSYFALKAGAALLKSIADMSIDVGRNYSFSVKGDAQFTYGGNKHEYIKGESTILKGDHSTQARQAAKNLQKTVSEIHDKKVQAFNETKGTKTPCPVCVQKLLTDKSNALSGRILQTLKKYLVPPWMPFPIDKIQKYLGMLIIPFLSVDTNFGLLGKSCGHPKCNNGMIETNDGKFQAANKVAETELKNKQNEITKQEKNIKASPSVDHHFDLHLKSGHEKNTIDPYAKKGISSPMITGHEAGKNGDLALSQKGAIEDMAIHVGVDSTPGGNIFLDAANKITLNAGAPGLMLSTNGHTEVYGGSIDVVSTSAGLTLASKSKTIISGKNIQIDADDRSGDGGVDIKSKSTHVSGKLSVDGDLSLLGSLRLNGAVHTPLLVTRSTRYQTTPSSPCIPESNTPNWNTPLLGTQQATQHSIWTDILYGANTAINKFETTVSSLTNIVQRTINKVNVVKPIDNNGQATGYAMVYDYVTKSPVDCYVTVLGVVCAGFVRPAMIPIFNAPHNHGMISGDHTHDFEAPAMRTYDSTKALNANSFSPSHVPTPAGEPTGLSPGPDSLGGDCGGNGSAFVNAANGIASRNAAYGITGDPYNGTNYVQAAATFNPDGSLAVAPNLSNFNDC